MAYSADQSSDYVGSIEFKEQKAGLFNKDAASFTLFSTITDRRTKKSVEHCVEKIGKPPHDCAESDKPLPQRVPMCSHRGAAGLQPTSARSTPRCSGRAHT